MDLEFESRPTHPIADGIRGSDKDALHDKLLVTGHQLEWLALAPDEVQPPRETVIRAAQWLARTLTEMDQKDLVDAYGPYTHAARALCLWRSADPNTLWNKAPGSSTAAAALPAVGG